MRPASLRGFGPVGTNGPQPAGAPVDVLAVMQKASLRIAELSSGMKTATEAELQEARAAVAELVEAGDNADKVLRNIIEAWVPVEHRAAFRSDVASLRKALAKFGGAA